MHTGKAGVAVIAAAWMILTAVPASAHFGTLVPSDDIVTQADSRTLTIQAKFIHPIELQYMEMAKPAQFGVMHEGEKVDLVGSLQEAKGKSPEQTDTFTFWKTDYMIRRPGDYTFYMVPTPYWEPAEDVFIIHYTKVCVNVLGKEKGWDKPVGLETEIIPLTRPYGLWTGNLFTGQVLVKGNPVPFAEVEIEYLNEAAEGGKKIVPPADPYVTQVVKADAGGVFSYAMPKAGWWGFAALNEADRTLTHNGVKKNIEIGAVFWVFARDIQ